MNQQEFEAAYLAELRVQFEPRWPAQASEWDKLKRFFTATATDDWARFKFEVLRQFTFDFWARGAAYERFGEDLSGRDHSSGTSV